MNVKIIVIMHYNGLVTKALNANNNDVISVNYVIIFCASFSTMMADINIK